MAASAVIATPLWAQPAAIGSNEPVRLSPLVVSAERDLLAAGTGGTEALASVSPLEPASDRLTDLFQRVPGLIAQDSFGGFDPPRLAVRGSGIQSAPTSRGLWIAFFGMPFNSADGSFNLALLESSWLDSAELIRGPAAGVPALGGSLMLGSAADVFAPGASVSGTYGSDEATMLSARGAYTADDYAVAGRAALTTSDGWRPHSREERESVFTSVRGELGDDADLTIQFFGTRPWYEVPGPLTKQAALTNPQSPVPAVMRDLPSRATEYAQLAARASKRWTGGQLSLAAGGIDFHDEFRQLIANGIGITDAREAWLGFNAEMDWAAGRMFDLLDQRTRLSALLQSGWWDASRYRNDHSEKGALVGEQRLRPLTFTAAIDHRLALAANQHVELGGSVLAARRDIDDCLAQATGTSPVDLDLGGSRFAPRAAWSWSPVKEATLVVSAARSYEPPTYNDLLTTVGTANTWVMRSVPLDWQRADSYEINAHGRHERLSWSSSLYYAPWRGEFLRLANEDGTTRGTVNAGRTLHTGFESTVEWDLLPDAATGLSCWATYNYTDARFDGDPVYGDRRLAGVPPHTGALGLRAVAPGGWFIAPGLQWRAGETYGDHANTMGYGGCGLWSLELGRRIPEHWSLSIAINNVFDIKTIASTAGVLDRAPSPQNAAIFLPAAGRSVELRLEAHW